MAATPLQMKRIDCARDDARPAIQALRDQLSPQGDIVSPQGRERTIAVFGEPLTPQQVVERVCRDVRERGLDAVLDYTAKFDRATLDRDSIRVSEAELADACDSADPAYLRAIRRVRENILMFQTGILHSDAVLKIDGRELRQRYRPLKRVGICIPGGAAAYPSSLLMTAVPAQAAGVAQIAVVVPPTAFGGYNRDLLAACSVLGINEVYRIGGAQAIAALAYGVEGIPAVDMIAGPGNIFVALAKKAVFGAVNIDSIAGPSEVVLVADATANPDYIASDLVSQAEHSPGASILITWHEPLIDRVQSALERQLAHLERGELARDSLEQFGALILARDEDEAVTLTNQIAPEHLHLSTANADPLSERMTNAGAIFLGHHAPVAVGDYAAGPSHVLPTGGTARWASGLCANDFLKRTSIIQVSRDGLERIAPEIRLLADVEGLTAHRHSVDIRLSPDSLN